MKKDMPVKGYQVGDTPTIEVFADGPTSPGGVRNTFVYGHHVNDYTFQLAGELNFQQGHPANVGINGLTLESVLAICLQRLNAFQKGPYPSDYNATAIMHIERGMEALKDRQREIQGINNPAPETGK